MKIKTLIIISKLLLILLVIYYLKDMIIFFKYILNFINLNFRILNIFIDIMINIFGFLQEFILKFLNNFFGFFKGLYIDTKQLFAEHFLMKKLPKQRVINQETFNNLINQNKFNISEEYKIKFNKIIERNNLKEELKGLRENRSSLEYLNIEDIKYKTAKLPDEHIAGDSLKEGIFIGVLENKNLDNIIKFTDNLRNNRIEDKLNNNSNSFYSDHNNINKWIEKKSILRTREKIDFIEIGLNKELKLENFIENSKSNVDNFPIPKEIILHKSFVKIPSLEKLNKIKENNLKLFRSKTKVNYNGIPPKIDLNLELKIIKHISKFKK